MDITVVFLSERQQTIQHRRQTEQFFITELVIFMKTLLYQKELIIIEFGNIQLGLILQFYNSFQMVMNHYPIIIKVCLAHIILPRLEDLRT